MTHRTDTTVAWRGESAETRYGHALRVSCACGWYGLSDSVSGSDTMSADHIAGRHYARIRLEPIAIRKGIIRRRTVRAPWRIRCNACAWSRAFVAYGDARQAGHAHTLASYGRTGLARRIASAIAAALAPMVDTLNASR